VSLMLTHITDRNVVLCHKTCWRMDILDLSAMPSYSLLVQITTADRLIERRIEGVAFFGPETDFSE